MWQKLQHRGPNAGPDTAAPPSIERRAGPLEAKIPSLATLGSWLLNGRRRVGGCMGGGGGGGPEVARAEVARAEVAGAEVARAEV